MADAKPRTAVVKAPAAIARALAGHAEARAIFAQLPPSHRREYVNWVTSAKKPDTLARRLEKLVPMLLAKRAKKR